VIIEGNAIHRASYYGRSNYFTVRVNLNSRLSGLVAVFPVVWDGSVAENKADEAGNSQVGADIVGEDQDAALSGFDADHGVGGLAVVAAFEEAVVLRSVEDDDACGSVEIFALLVGRW
jgi:hypothetical protein